MRRLHPPVLLLAALLGAGPALAQSAPGPIPVAPVTPEVRADVIDTVASQLLRIYVSEDTARLIAEHLRARRAAGAYDGATDPHRFAELLTADLRAINHDGHLMVEYAPGEAGEPIPPGGLPTPGTQRDTTAPPAEVLASWRRNHFGFARVDILTGNVGYWEIHGFADGAEARAAAEAALRYLATTDAVILDLRNMGGGSGDMSNFILSHFTGPDSIRSLRITNRSAGESVDRWTLQQVPGPRRAEVPLYILTSRGTVSAGEDFTFVLHNLHRATTVGDRTAGAGHMNAFVSSGHGFLTSISFTRVSDPVSGREWERVGVPADLPVAPEQALATAHAHALSALAARADNGPTRNLLRLAREYVEAEARARPVPAGSLRQYAGRYEGDRDVSIREGRLWLVREAGLMPQELVPLGDNRFALGATTRISFERAGKQWQLRVTRPNGASLTYAKVAR